MRGSDGLLPPQSHVAHWAPRWRTTILERSFSLLLKVYYGILEGERGRARERVEREQADPVTPERQVAGGRKEASLSLLVSVVVVVVLVVLRIRKEKEKLEGGF